MDTQDQAVDPIADPDRYRRYLLAALGDDDPAVAQTTTIAALRELVAEAGDALRGRPRPTEWSVLECIGHIVDGEVVAAARYRWIVAQDEPELVGYDQDRWVARLHHVEADPDSLLDLFAALRTVNVQLWRRLPPQDRARIGMHRERGPESYELTFRLIAGHDRVHLAQARDTLAAVRSSDGDRRSLAPRSGSGGHPTIGSLTPRSRATSTALS
ncbi:MAG: DinB family protein [Chloroflexi bacterium]|nr:DinB family protein [Chloroflexota bacterium]